MSSAPTHLIGQFDQLQAETGEQIDKMIGQWRTESAAGQSDFDIFGHLIASVDRAKPSYERLAVLVALMTERLASVPSPGIDKGDSKS